MPLGEITGPFAEFASRHHCYIVCPTYTKQDGRYFNSVVFIDRQGKVWGKYRKMHPTTGEMDQDITPGPIDPPVFQTDFGIVGWRLPPCVRNWLELRTN